MGGSDSKHLNGVKEIRKEAHPLLGDISEALLTQTQQPTLMKVYTSSDEADHRERVRRMKHRRSRTSPYLLNLIKIEESNSSQFCGVTNRLYCFYECFEQDLDCLYHERVLKKTRFTQQQLIDIASAVLGGLIFIQDNELKRSYLSKKSIVYAGNQVKILDQLLVERLHPYYLLLQREGLDDDVFLSPELLKELARSNLDPYLSPKSDIFALGMLLLHAACLQSLESFYDYEQLTVDLESIQTKISRLRYSSGFRSLLSMMIDGNEDTRPGVVTLQERLDALIKQPTNSAARRPEENMRIETDYMVPPSVSHKRSKTSRSSVNLAYTYSDLDTVKASEEHLPVMLRIPQRKAVDSSPPSVKELPAPSRIEQRSVTDYSTMINKLYKQKTYHLEDQTDGETLPPIPSGCENGESPIRKINGLMDNTMRQSFNLSHNSNYGRVVYSHGGYYEGQLSEGNPHGNGILYYRSGKVFYSGSWANNHFDGFGTLHQEIPLEAYGAIDYKDFDAMDQYWLRYEGEFRQDCREGFGSVYYSNGEKFSGCFRNDKAEGFGTFYRKEGPPLNGVWQQNRFNH